MLAHGRHDSPALGMTTWTGPRGPVGAAPFVSVLGGTVAERQGLVHQDVPGSEASGCTAPD